MGEDKKNDSDIIQQLDQMATHMENIAEIMAVYFQALVKKKFTREEAFSLTLDYSDHLLGWIYKRNDHH